MPRPKKTAPNRSDNRYEVKITIGKKIDGSSIRKSFYSSISKEDAQQKANEYTNLKKAHDLAGISFVENEITFKEWAEKWLNVYKKNEVDENTFRFTYENTLKNHLLPYFAKIKLKDIKQLHIKDFYSTKANMSQSMISKMKICLNAIFETAIDNDLCYKNPAKKVDFISKIQKNIKKVYTDEQAKEISSIAIDKMPEVVLLLETGLRRGELLGLKWKDIDFNNNTLSVNRSIAICKGKLFGA